VHAVEARVGDDLASRLDSVQHRHLNVDEGYVGQVFYREPDRLSPVGGLGDDLEIILSVQQGPEAGADERLVVDE
jgi:hypothetical protein